jgi:lysylphosphatidylglycerol synthetase-like protein (DUF2156 family)
MNSITPTIPAILRPRELDDLTPLRARRVLPVILGCSMLYGAAMGSFAAHGPPNPRQMLYSAVKVPMLLAISFALTLPSYFLFCTLTGLRSDFRQAIRSIITAQAGLSITLAALCPFLPLWYASCGNYAHAILFNGLLFAAASAAGQVLLRRFSRSLIDRNPGHRRAIRLWLIVYTFVAIQMAWVLRPFIGGPGAATTFFRHGAWGNAYVEVWNLMR